MKTSRVLIYAAVASVVVSVPMTLASMIFASVNAGISQVLMHPGFWIFFGRGILWMSLTSFFASVLTLLLVTRRLTRET